MPCRVICSIDEYYRKRKQVALAEAVEYVQSIQKRFKRDPFKRELYEEFIYFTHKDNIEQYEQEGSPVKSQLGIAYILILSSVMKRISKIMRHFYST